MSRLDELLVEYAPDGVQYYELGDVAAYSDTRVDADELDGTTFVGVDNLLPQKGGKRDSAFEPTTDRVTAYEAGDVLIGNIRPYLKKIWLADSSGGCSGDVLAIRIKEDFKGVLTPRFLYYALSADAFFAHDMQFSKGAKMPRGDRTSVLRFRMPVPPLAVQQQVVATLDTFQALQSRLHEELTARQRQYTFYRDRLLSFDGRDVRRAPLGEVATVVRGASPRPIQAFLTNGADGVPWIKIGDVAAGSKYITSTAERVTPAGASKSRRVQPGDFVLSNSMSFGRPYITSIEGCIHDGWLALSDFSESFQPDFLYHLLRSAPVQAEFARRAGNGTVRNLNADIVKAVVVPIPGEEVQQEIADLLDKFDLLVNDPNVGLPAEIRTRLEQFEHYRDRLLNYEGATA